MEQSTVRAVVGWMLLLSHLAAIFSAPFFLISFNDAMDVILILCPLTGAFVLIIVQHYAEVMAIADPPHVKLNKNAAVMTMFLCIALCVAVIGVQYLYWLGRIADIDTLKRAVGIIDTVIGGYTAIMIKRLFASP